MTLGQYRRVPAAYSTKGNAMKYDRKLRAPSEVTAYPSMLAPEIEARLHNLLEVLSSGMRGPLVNWSCSIRVALRRT